MFLLVIDCLIGCWYVYTYRATVQARGALLDIVARDGGTGDGGGTGSGTGDGGGTGSGTGRNTDCPSRR